MKSQGLLVKIVLEALYTRLENGKPLDTGDLDRELRGSYRQQGFGKWIIKR